MKMKKIIALLVVFSTLASLFTFAVAASTEETASVQLSKEDFLLIEKLEALGAITNSYDAQNYVTRADMAEIVARYMRLPVTDRGATTSPFYDVSPKSEAYGAIVALYDMGIVSGNGNLNFNPDNYVTYDEALVFVVNAVGHKIFAMREGGYPTGYHRVAIKLGMLKNLSVNKGTDYIKLTDVYRIMDSALSAATVETTYYGDGNVHYALSDTETFLSEVYGIRKYRGIVTGNENTRLARTDSSLSDEQIEIDGVIYDTPGYVYGYFLGYQVDYYLRTNSVTNIDLIYVEETNKANTVTRIDAKDIIVPKTTSDRIYYKDENNKEYHVDLITGFDAIYNHQSWVGYGSIGSLLPVEGYIEVLDNDNDGAYEVLFTYEYENYIVSAVDTYNQKVYDKINTAVPLELDPSLHKVSIYLAGDKTTKKEFSDIAPDQVLAVMSSKGTNKIITVYICDNTVSGKIVAYNSNMGYQIGENFYEAAYNYTATEALTPGLSGTFYLDINNKIVTYKYDATGSTALYAAMAALDYKIGMETQISIKLYTQEGEMAEYRLADKVYIDNNDYYLSNSQDVDFIIKTISKDYYDSSDGCYKVNKSYIVRFETTTDGKIKSLDLGGVRGMGKLNVLADSYEYMLVRFNGMYQAKATGTETKVFGRFDRTNGLMFSTPAEGNLDKTEQFEIIPLGDFKDNKSYKSPTYSGNATNAIAGPISLYSDNSSDNPYTNVILFEGWNASTADVSTTDTKIAVITDVTDALDSDGTRVKKLYFMDGASALVNDQIKYWKGTAAPDVALKNISTLTTATPPALAEIRPGVVIQYAKNDEGLIDTIRFVSEYNGHSITPLFYTAGSNPYEEFNLGVEKTNEDSLAVCEVVVNDTKTNLLTVKVGTDDYIVYTGAITDCVLYNSDTEKATAISIYDLVPTDKFVARIIGYYSLAEIVVFR